MFAWLRVAVATAAMASWIGATTVPFGALPRAASLEPRKAAFAIWPLVLYPGLLATATLHHDGARAPVALPLCVSLQLTYAWAWAIGASASSEGEDDGDEDRRGGRHLARNGAAIALLGATAFAWRALAHARGWGALAIGAYAGWMGVAALLTLATRWPDALDEPWALAAASALVAVASMWLRVPTPCASVLWAVLMQRRFSLWHVLAAQCAVGGAIVAVGRP